MLPELPHTYIGSAIVIPVDALRAWLLDEAKRDDRNLDDRIQSILDEPQ